MTVSSTLCLRLQIRFPPTGGGVSFAERKGIPPILAEKGWYPLASAAHKIWVNMAKEFFIKKVSQSSSRIANTLTIYP